MRQWGQPEAMALEAGDRRDVKPAILLVAGILVMFLLLAWLSVAQYRGYNQHAMDLARMSQAMWSVLHGRPLVWTGDGIAWSRLANHVELIYFPLALVYALWRSPATLQLVQAALFVSGAVPVYRLARRQLASQPALLLAFAYLLYPVAQTAVLFELHGDTLAAPLLLWAIEAADRRAWRAYAVWTALALSCKVYVAAPIAVLGLLLWQRGDRRAGAVTGLVALLWGAFAFFVIRAIFAPGGEATSTPGSYLSFYFLNAGLLDSLPERLITAVIAIGPLILLVWRAPLWLLPAAVVILPALASNGPGPSYDYRYHHYILGVPFLLAAAIYGAAAMRLREGEYGAWRRRVRLTFAVTLLFNALLVDTPLNPRFFLSDEVSGVGLTPSQYRRTERDDFKDRWLAAIPERAPIMADDTLAERLINRPTYLRTKPLFSTLEEQLPAVEYVAVDGLYDYVVAAGGVFYDGGVFNEHDTISLLLADPDFVLERADDGLLLFSRDGLGLRQQVERRSYDGRRPLAAFADTIMLVNVQVERLSATRYTLEFAWTTERPMNDRPALVAVSQLGSLPHSRILHLPTLALLPTTEWEPGELVVESFEIKLADETARGDYELAVGWYETSNPYAPFTDERSRFGELHSVATLIVADE